MFGRAVGKQPPDNYDGAIVIIILCGCRLRRG